MNTTELVNKIIEKNPKDIASKAAAERIVASVFDEIRGAVSAGEEVRIYRFGTFEPVKKAARTGTNPQTGEKIKIKAHGAVRFAPAKDFKDAAAKGVKAKKK